MWAAKRQRLFKLKINPNFVLISRMLIYFYFSQKEKWVTYVAVAFFLTTFLYLTIESIVSKLFGMTSGKAGFEAQTPGLQSTRAYYRVEYALGQLARAREQLEYCERTVNCHKCIICSSMAVNAVSLGFPLFLSPTKNNSVASATANNKYWYWNIKPLNFYNFKLPIKFVW